MGGRSLPGSGNPHRGRVLDARIQPTQPCSLARLSVICRLVVGVLLRIHFFAVAADPPRISWPIADTSALQPLVGPVGSPSANDHRGAVVFDGGLWPARLAVVAEVARRAES